MPFIVLTLWKLKDLGVFFYGTKEIERTQNLTWIEEFWSLPDLSDILMPNDIYR